MLVGAVCEAAYGSDLGRIRPPVWDIRGNPTYKGQLPAWRQQMTERRGATAVISQSGGNVVADLMCNRCWSSRGRLQRGRKRSKEITPRPSEL